MKTASPFPVYERLVFSGVLRPEPGTKFIQAQQPFDVVCKGDGGQDMRDFGPLRPPYPSMWFEATAGSWAMPVAVHVTFIGETGDKAAHGIQIFPIQRWNPHPNALLLGSVFLTGPDGRLVDGIQPATSEQDEKAVKALTAEEYDACFRGMRIFSAAALFTLSLMHCKNVHQRQAVHQPEPRRRHSTRKRPAIEYHVIELPTPRGQAGGSGKTGNHPGARLHTVRGHFKTYTAEKPLLGRAVGTYYWSNHARGSAENGEIISSYQVKEGVPA